MRSAAIVVVALLASACGEAPREDLALRVEYAGCRTLVVATHCMPSHGTLTLWVQAPAGATIEVDPGSLRVAPAAPVAQPAMAGGYGMGGGYGPGMPQQGPMGGGGSGLMGVGLGVAGGVAAGMLAERLLNGGHDERGTAHQADAGAGAGAAGGLIPGSFGGDDSAATELTRRDFDFGSGDGWGGGDAGGGDFGGGDSDDW